MEFLSLNNEISESKIQESLEVILKDQKKQDIKREELRRIFSFMDYTSLEGSDTHEKIKNHCERAIAYGEKGLPFPAAVCIYPPFIATALKTLHGTPIKVATTAAAFPSGQMSLSVKLAEIDFAVQEGADEIDVVISRGTFLEQQYETVFYELAAIRAHCHGKTLKVILETGELQGIENIVKASQIAINAGADFIKTSTGKTTPAATLVNVYAMLQVIKAFHLHTGKKIGIKPAGGIADPEHALDYYRVVHGVLGESWLTPSLFRIGASRLADRISDLL
jgi:deoxyribose-phosphate aldolase